MQIKAVSGWGEREVVGLVQISVVEGIEMWKGKGIVMVIIITPLATSPPTSSTTSASTATPITNPTA